MDRSRAIERIRVRLLRRGWPRFVATAALVTAGAVGFLSSFVLLSAGLADMAIRYAVATSIAYLSFLLCLRAFVALARSGSDADPLDVVDLASDWGDSSAGVEATEPAGAVVDLAGVDLSPPDLDDGLVLLVPLCLAAAGILAVVYTVTMAPTLLAELLLDAVIVSGLARRFARIDPVHWSRAAFRRTWLPFLAVLATATVAGFLAHLVAPGADSIGDVFRPS